MGKVTFEFDSIEEQEDILTVANADNWKLAVWELQQFLRSKIKYEEYSKEVYDAFECVQEELNDIIISKGLKFD